MRIKKIICLFSVILLTACTREYRPTESYTLKNNLNENYTIEYTEKSGFPDTHVDVVIYNSENKIADYLGGKYKNIEAIKPQRIMFLCNTNDYELYYIGNDNGDSIVISGNDSLGFKDNIADLRREWIDVVYHSHYNEYIILSKDLRNNYTESELKEKFVKCGYDYTAIMYLYDLAS